MKVDVNFDSGVDYVAYCRPRIISSYLVSLGVDFIRFSGSPNLFSSVLIPADIV
jgi:hypothetical protein